MLPPIVFMLEAERRWLTTRSIKYLVLIPVFVITIVGEGLMNFC